MAILKALHYKPMSADAIKVLGNIEGLIMFETYIALLSVDLENNKSLLYKETFQQL